MNRKSDIHSTDTFFKKIFARYLNATQLADPVRRERDREDWPNWCDLPTELVAVITTGGATDERLITRKLVLR